jgi:hypothetical protein
MFTELTTIVWGSAPGWLWCSAASSAAEFLAAEVPMAPVTPVLFRADDAVVIRCVLPI